jgi:hypothetical protein
MQAPLNLQKKNIFPSRIAGTKFRINCRDWHAWGKTPEEILLFKSITFFTGVI